MEPEQPFLPQLLRRRFTVVLSDYVLAVLGPTWDRLVLSPKRHTWSRDRFRNSPDDATLLREGCRPRDWHLRRCCHRSWTRPPLTDVRPCGERSPADRQTASALMSSSIPQVQIAPRGKPGGYVDDILAERGLSCRVASRRSPTFTARYFWCPKATIWSRFSETDCHDVRRFS